MNGKVDVEERAAAAKERKLIEGSTDRNAPAAEVDEALLAGPMDLSHREREELHPRRVPRAELAVLVPVGVCLAVLLRCMPVCVVR